MHRDGGWEKIPKETLGGCELDIHRTIAGFDRTVGTTGGLPDAAHMPWEAPSALYVTFFGAEHFHLNVGYERW